MFGNAVPHLPERASPLRRGQYADGRQVSPIRRLQREAPDGPVEDLSDWTSESTEFWEDETTSVHSQEDQHAPTNLGLPATSAGQPGAQDGPMVEHVEFSVTSHGATDSYSNSDASSINMPSNDNRHASRLSPPLDESGHSDRPNQSIPLSPTGTDTGSPVKNTFFLRSSRSKHFRANTSSCHSLLELERLKPVRQSCRGESRRRDSHLPSWQRHHQVGHGRRSCCT
jgi:hypothetical protein